MEATATQRQLARRRREGIAQRSRLQQQQQHQQGVERYMGDKSYRTPGALKRSRGAAPVASTASTFVAVVRPSNTSTRIGATRTTQGSASSGRMAVSRPPRQMLNPKTFANSNPYENNLPTRGERPVTLRSKLADTKTRNRPSAEQFRTSFGRQATTSFTRSRTTAPHPTSAKTRSNLKTIKPKVDCHLCPPSKSHCHAHRHGPPQPLPGGGQNKSLVEAHEQLELLLTRIERANDNLPPLPLSGLHAGCSTAGSGRHGARRLAGQGQGAARVAKGQRRQWAPTPPVPAGSPMASARGTYPQPQMKIRSREVRESGGGSSGDGSGTQDEVEQPTGIVPLTCNPQHLPPAKREALIKLLQGADQHDKGIVDIVRGVTGDAPRDTILMMLQMLPLSLKDSPYAEKFWEGHRYLKECQELRQKIRTEERFKDGKLPHTPGGHSYFSHNLENELKDEKLALEYMELEMRRRHQHSVVPPAIEPDGENPLNERQEQAMRERAELEEHKQKVTQCRERRRQREFRKQMVELIKEQTDNGLVTDSNLRVQVDDVKQERQPIQLTNPLSAVVPSDPWEELCCERNRFQAHCKRSCFYNHSRSPAPWKVYAKVAASLSTQLMESIDVDFNRSVASYIKDFVAGEMTM
ncbi:hypothetical protein KR074_000226 [Drosophila pseudoananassae]|nr:hypothetical protein KR074_000226 [Drosophila pseudoananassae]